MDGSTCEARALGPHLERLAEQLRTRAPLADDGSPAQLAALLPCEPVVGDVAVACWVASDGGERFDLVRLEDGTSVDDHTALREALTLLAMTETLEELVDFGQVTAIRGALHAWRDGTPPADDALDAQLDAGLAALDALELLAPGAEPQVVRTSWLDQVGAALREMETCWTRLERSAERWSDGLLEPDPTATATVERVQALWAALGAARRGPLARPASAALHEGREAGAAMAAAIAEAQREER